MSGGLRADIEVVRGDFTVNLTLDVAAGTTVALMGPSGAGKSTVLHALARRIPVRRRQVRFQGHPTRGVVLLGQDPRLFPHLSARHNVAFGLRAHGTSKRAAADQAQDWLSRVGLDGYGDRRPAQLSGGQQQRVAIARALATTPDALLLDEPLTALDIETAAQVRMVLRDELAVTGTTAIIATHEAVDAVALASELIVLEQGVVTQRGPMREVLAEPATRFVAAVAGLNRLSGQVRNGRFVAGAVTMPLAPGLVRSDREATAVFRPSDVHVHEGEAVMDEGWRTQVAGFEITPGGVRLRVVEPDIAVDVTADVAAALELRPGAPVALSLDPGAIRLL
ncbi:MAG: sulfate/molybdate ABC transporter ATP-binding protein [Beutenbergiaceae bacterium]